MEVTQGGATTHSQGKGYMCRLGKILNQQLIQAETWMPSFSYKNTRLLMDVVASPLPLHP